MTTTPNPATMPGAGLRHIDHAVCRADGDTPMPPPRNTPAEETNPNADDETPEPPEQPRAAPIPQPPPIPAPRPLTREQYVRKFCLDYAIRYFTGLSESDENDVFTAAKTWSHWVLTGA